MTNKRVITQIAEVDKLLEKLFPDGWIDSLIWTDEEKAEAAILKVKRKSLMPRTNCLSCFLRR